MTLPPWCAPLPDAERMRATDRWAIEERGIPSLELMERAGAALADLAARVIPEGPIAVVCGKGNNGGDGYVAARILRERLREVHVLTTVPLEELTGDARANLERLPGLPPERFDAAVLDVSAGAIDAILGTGVTGAPHGAAAEAIAELNATGLPVVAADVPSGVDASTGAVAGEAVRAAATATFHRAKPGLWIAPGKAHAGEVEVVDIAIPDLAPVTPPDVGLMTAEVLSSLPDRAAASTKFTSGHVLIAGGSRGLTGATILASSAAMRAGAGYVTACVPGSLEAIFETHLLEVMTRALPDDDGAHVQAGAQAVLDAAAQRGGALVLGCGIGRSDGAVAFARTVAAGAEVALVLDADGLNAHAGFVEALARRSHPTVLTPHAGELARLLGTSSDAIEQARLASARGAARRSGAVVVLKGDDTIVAHPDGRAAVSPGGAPALATAGTGDVLAGVTGALLAQGLEPFTAACAAVWAHRVAGRLAAAPHGPRSVIASDVVAALPAALAA